MDFITQKMGKRLGALQKDRRTSTRPAPRRYVAGLSFGPSSSAMAQNLDLNAKRHASKKSSSAFEPLVVHIDTDLSYPKAENDTAAMRLLQKYRERFPNIMFECVPLTEVWDVRSIDWSALPAAEGADAVERLRHLFDNLPTVTARADVLRLLVRHLLLHVAIQRSYSALLLGNSTTSLAALTLSEVANGRGFSVPWQINDGLFTVYTYDQALPTDEVASVNGMGKIEFPIYYPFREVFRNEIAQYIELEPSLTDLIPPPSSTGSSVVSYKDLSIEEVMQRYFDGVQESYSGIVANVVRTAGKLNRVAGQGFCGSCGNPLDEQGDSTWAGEMGDEADGLPGASDARKICYGCKRSIHG